MANKIFLDTNIVLDELFNDRENSKYTNAIIDKYLSENTIFVISNLSLNTIFYIGVEKNKQWKKTFNFIKNIAFNNPLFEIYYIQKKDLKEIYDYMDKNINADFLKESAKHKEDLQQYIGAKNSSCKAIITNDKNFPKLDIPLIRTNPNIENYTPKN